MKKKPVFLNLFLIRFPVTAIVSIFHRVTGVVFFFFVPIFLYFIYISLSSSDNFIETKNIIYKYRFIFLVFACCFLYHVVAGFRHILMDLGIGENKKIATRTAYFVIFFLLLLYLLFLGIIIWYLL